MWNFVAEKQTHFEKTGSKTMLITDYFQFEKVLGRPLEGGVGGEVLIIGAALRRRHNLHR